MTPLSTLVRELLDHYEPEGDRSNAPLLDRVRELVDPGSSGPSDDRKTLVRKAAVAPSPTADGPFHLLGDVRADARLLELDLRAALGLHPLPAVDAQGRRQRRGWSDRNTADALRALVVLTDALPDDPLTERVADRVAHLHSRARLLTGHRELWLRVPVACPVCECSSLRQNPRDGSVRCVRPGCVDDAGERTSWSVQELGWLGRLVTEDEPVAQEVTA